MRSSLIKQIYSARQGTKLSKLSAVLLTLPYIQSLICCSWITRSTRHLLCTNELEVCIEKWANSLKQLQSNGNLYGWSIFHAIILLVINMYKYHGFAWDRVNFLHRSLDDDMLLICDQNSNDTTLHNVLTIAELTVLTKHQGLQCLLLRPTINTLQMGTGWALARARM